MQLKTLFLPLILFITTGTLNAMELKEKAPKKRQSRSQMEAAINALPVVISARGWFGDMDVEDQIRPPTPEEEPLYPKKKHSANNG